MAPNTVTYKALINACEKGNQLEQALELLDLMKQKGVMPNVFIYNGLISACEKGNQLKQAMEIFGAMKQQGVLPNLMTYNTLISACEKGAWLEQALELFEKMKRQGIAPNRMTYNVLISACEKGNQPQRAAELFIMQLHSETVFREERLYEKGISGEGVAQLGHLWLALRQQTAYMPQLPTQLPQALAQDGIHIQQEDELKLHAEKALAGLLACGEDDLNVSIEFNACTDCLEFFQEGIAVIVPHHPAAPTKDDSYIH